MRDAPRAVCNRGVRVGHPSQRVLVTAYAVPLHGDAARWGPLSPSPSVQGSLQTTCFQPQVSASVALRSSRRSYTMFRTFRSKWRSFGLCVGLACCKQALTTPCELSCMKSKDHGLATNCAGCRGAENKRLEKNNESVRGGGREKGKHGKNTPNTRRRFQALESTRHFWCDPPASDPQALDELHNRARRSSLRVARRACRLGII